MVICWRAVPVEASLAYPVPGMTEYREWGVTIRADWKVAPALRLMRVAGSALPTGPAPLTRLMVSGAALAALGIDTVPTLRSTRSARRQALLNTSSAFLR